MLLNFPGVRRFLTLLAFSFPCLLAAEAEPLRVSALHPLMADLARQVGGEHVEVFDVVSEGSNPHRFEPKPEDLTQLQSSKLVLAAGMGMEPYLSRIQDTLKDTTVVEIGKTIPALSSCGSHSDCGHDHGNTSHDPHWWHSIDHMSRASRVMEAALSKADPGNASAYKQQALAYRETLTELKRWAKLELAKVPRHQRKLVTAHHAFGYFADEFGFEVIAIAGLNQEQDTTPKELAKTIADVREANVAAIFPEAYSSTKPIEAVSEETGIKIGTALIADGNGEGDAAGFEGMIRHNVKAITQALAQP